MKSPASGGRTDAENLSGAEMRNCATILLQNGGGVKAWPPLVARKHLRGQPGLALSKLRVMAKPTPLRRLAEMAETVIVP